VVDAAAAAAAAAVSAASAEVEAVAIVETTPLLSETVSRNAEQGGDTWRRCVHQGLCLNAYVCRPAPRARRGALLVALWVLCSPQQDRPVGR